MTTQTESHIKHHPDDWSSTSHHHHHVERTVHPVIVELIKWVCTYPASSSLTFERQAVRCPFTYILLSSLQRESIHDLKCFSKRRMLTANLAQATQTLPPNSSSAVLDDGCGIGTVTAEVKKSFPDLPILAIDSSAGMLEALNRKAKKHDWTNVSTRLLDGGNLTGTPTLHDPLSTCTTPRSPFTSAAYSLVPPKPITQTSLVQTGSTLMLPDLRRLLR